MRCHDVWDDFPKIGIHGAWASWLGFNNDPVHQEKFYEVHQIGPICFGDFSRQILEKVKKIKQEAIHIIGDEAKMVNRVAIGTGAITDYKWMYRMGADVIILTDDGTRLWESGQWSEESGIPIIVVNHATAEEPGMRSLAKYLQDQFPNVPIHAIERGCLYKSIN
jgi:putative NIF3 family GTP cyclohydrolase 1 type 2